MVEFDVDYTGGTGKKNSINYGKSPNAASPTHPPWEFGKINGPSKDFYYCVLLLAYEGGLPA